MADKKHSIPIYTAADWNYRSPLRVMLLSLDRFVRAGSVVDVYVLCKSEDYTKYENWIIGKLIHIRVNFIVIDESKIGGVPLYGHTGVMTYVRLLLENDQTCPHERVLYLDADILLRNDIIPILDATLILSSPIAAVRECGPFKVSDCGGVFNWKELGLPRNQPYYNAGVLGLNLKLIRTNRLFKAALEYLKTHGRCVVSWDQGAINAVAGNMIEQWPEKWNFTSSYCSIFERTCLEINVSRKIAVPENAVIAHFTGAGAKKPWHVNSVSPFKGEYQGYLNSWPGHKMQISRLERILSVPLAGAVRECWAYVWLQRKVAVLTTPVV